MMTKREFLYSVVNVEKTGGQKTGEIQGQVQCFKTTYLSPCKI